MLFNSVHFLIFFPIVCMGYYIVPNRSQCAFHLDVSGYFYACWNLRYIIMLMLCTVVIWIVGLEIARWKNGGVLRGAGVLLP